MAWIETHQELRDHPKVKELGRLMGWNNYEATGRLMHFWLWCLQHALDGDLRKFNDCQIADAAGVAAADATRFVEAMVTCGNSIDAQGNRVVSGFIDREPYFRVHDWTAYVGKYIDLKYRRSNPQTYTKIKSNYSRAKTRLKHGNQTLPDLTKGVDVNVKGVCIGDMGHRVNTGASLETFEDPAAPSTPFPEHKAAAKKVQGLIADLAKRVTMTGVKP